MRGPSTLGLLRQAASSPLLPGKHRLVGKAGICKFLRREPRPIQGPLVSKLKFEYLTYPYITTLNQFNASADCAGGPQQSVAHLVLTLKATARSKDVCGSQGAQSESLPLSPL